jgi:diguanylate cyclase (GGDEF)-like protein
VSRAWGLGAVGVALAMGAPLGWLAWHWPNWSGLGDELRGHASLYLYLTVGTAIAFGSFGATVGRLAERNAAARRELERLAAVDDLTGLRNARIFHLELPRACASAQRSGQPVSLIMIDVDQFKRVNDTYGHGAGDQALAHVGALLSRLARAADAPFRVGGEEFAVLCPDTRAEDAHRLAERVRLTMEEEPPIVDGHPIRMTGSLGVAALASDANPDALFRLADAALYRAKSLGRNQVQMAQG